MQQEIFIEEEIKKSYLEYSLSVIIGRAIPDVRDGLKPVHRRILYAMHELGNYYNRPYKKSARIVGDVIGKYHPHGDSAVYDALVRMAQNFNMRYPLIDGQGNFGSIDGDAPAAMRYTESRMSKLAAEFLADIDKNTVNFRSNYDNTLKEPEILPTKVPNLLVNGSSGIAVGMATNIPPHNLGEVVDAVLYSIDHPSCSLDELLTKIKGPDFPTGAIVYGLKGLRAAYATGRGSFKIRSAIHIEKNKKGHESIVITEIPYALNKSNLIKKIALLINEQKIQGISDLRDESDRTGIRIVIELKRGSYSDIIINKLYKFTSLETSFGFNMMAVVDNKPKLLNLREYLSLFYNHRKEIVLLRTKYDLDKAEFRAHILEGLKKALEFIDEIVELIKKSASPKEAKNKLMKRFSFSELQSQAILDMRLQRLTNLEHQKILEEYKEVIKKIEYLTSIIENEEVLKSVIKNELIELSKKFDSPRRTKILSTDPDQIEVEDIIPDEEVVITLSAKGYIKRTPLANYHKQRRGGKGTLSSSQGSDFINTIITTSNHQSLILFTNQGRMLSLKVFQIPESSRRAKGIHISNLLDLKADENVATMVSQRDLRYDNYFLFITKNGLVKRSKVDLYKNLRSNGLIALGLRDNDELIAVKEVPGECEIILFSSQGFAIRFNINDIRPTGRTASGVKGISLRKDDVVVSGVVVKPGDKTFVLTVSINGYGKRTDLDQYRLQARGGKGIINLKPDAKTGLVLGARTVEDNDQIIMLTSGNKIIRFAVNDVRICSRAAKGVKLIKMEPGEEVVCFDKIEG